MAKTLISYGSTPNQTWNPKDRFALIIFLLEIPPRHGFEEELEIQEILMSQSKSIFQNQQQFTRSRNKTRALADGNLIRKFLSF